MPRRRPARDLRTAVDCLPLQTRRAMLQGIESNRIIVGAYVDRKGGVCPMLAAHRNGGRTSLASFARAWDRYTGVTRPRLATRRELRALRAILVSTLAGNQQGGRGSIAEAAALIRAEREAAARRQGREADPPAEAGEYREAGDRPPRPLMLPGPRHAWIGTLLAEAERRLADRGVFERPLRAPGTAAPPPERSAAHPR
jgi:hypothetical protein